MGTGNGEGKRKGTVEEGERGTENGARRGKGKGTVEEGERGTGNGAKEGKRERKK